MNTGKSRSRRYSWEDFPAEPAPICPVCGCRSSIWMTDDLGAVLGCDKCLELRSPAALHKKRCPVCGEKCARVLVRDRKVVGCDVCTTGKEAFHWTELGLTGTPSRRLRYV